MQLPLSIDVGGSNWIFFSVRALDPKFEVFSKKIIERDNLTCRYCSFKAYSNMFVVNIDKNYSNNTLENFALACPLCAQCFFIEAAGRDGFGGGKLIFLPEITQNDLNGLCHALFCSMSMNARSSNRALDIYESLKLRAQIIEKKWQSGLSDPNFMGQMILDSNINNNDNKKVLLTHLRLLPSYEGVSEYMKSWIYDAKNNMTQHL